MKSNQYFKKMIKTIEHAPTIMDIYHQKSQNGSFMLDQDGYKNRPKEWKKVYFKTYPRLAKKFLKIGYLDKKIKNLIAFRNSTRKFSQNKFPTFSDISTLLYYSAGIVHPDKNIDLSTRSYPSAGARYPIEVYIVVLKANDIDRGLYHYNVLDNTFEILTRKSYSQWYKKTIGNTPEKLKDSHILVILTGIFYRSKMMYGERSYRYILLEAGHLAQNICLLASQFNMRACPVGEFIDSEVENELDITFQKESVLYMISLGKLAE